MIQPLFPKLVKAVIEFKNNIIHRNNIQSENPSNAEIYYSAYCWRRLVISIANISNTVSQKPEGKIHFLLCSGRQCVVN
jgi:hypothetical protein